MASLVSPVHEQSRLPSEKILDVLVASHEINGPETFVQWARTHLYRVFPHVGLIAGIGRIGASYFRPEKFLANDFPVSHFSALGDPFGDSPHPLLSRWILRNEPQLYDGPFSADESDVDRRGSFDEREQSVLAAHGMRGCACPLVAFLS
jgi:hypothetical protein